MNCFDGLISFGRLPPETWDYVKPRGPPHESGRPGLFATGSTSRVGHLRRISDEAHPGALEVCPVHDEHGWRLGRVVDPFGHEWEIGRPFGEWPPR